MDTKNECKCRLPAKERFCGHCGHAVCKNCEELMPKDAFHFAPSIAESLQYSRYCFECFNSFVAPAISEYEENLAKAKDITHVSINYKRPLPIEKEALTDINVVDCKDKAETVLKLGYLAAIQGYNAIIRTKVESQKVRNHAYQTSAWSGKARPANLTHHNFFED